MERIPAVFNTNVEELHQELDKSLKRARTVAYSNGKKGNVRVSVIDIVDNRYSCFSGSVELGEP